MKKWLSLPLIICLALVSVPVFMVQADSLPAVHVAAPSNVQPGSSFVARINFEQAADLNAYQIQLDYDAAIIQVVGPEGGPTGVTAGQVGGVTIPVDMWTFYPHGAPGGIIRVVGRIPGNLGVNGSGYLAEVHFTVLGLAGQNTEIIPTDAPLFASGLFDSLGVKMPTAIPWVGTIVQVPLPYVPGDANGDGTIDMGDVTKVELIILGLAPETPGADVNGDGFVDMGDVTKIELIILGL